MTQTAKDQLLMRRIITAVALVTATSLYLWVAWPLLSGVHCPLYTDTAGLILFVPVLLLIAGIARPRLGAVLPILVPLGLFGTYWVVGSGLSCALS